MKIRRTPSSTDTYQAVDTTAKPKEQRSAAFESGGTIPDELTHPGGLLEELINWICSSSDRPSRVLALSAALPFLGALMGRRFAGPTDLRSNIYTVALAPSGYGKDHARSQLKRLMSAAGLVAFAGPNRFMSATALRTTVMEKPSCFCMFDEFGGMMRQITDPRAGIHNQLIRSDLLEIFSAAGSYFEGSAYAKSKPVTIHNPNFCFSGTSTPRDFWAALTSMNTTDGLLARMILFCCHNPRPPRVAPQRNIRDVPPDLVEWCQALVGAGRGPGNLGSNGRLDHGEQAVIAVVVPLDADASKELEDFKEHIERRQVTATPQAEPVLNRAAEHAQKLALVASVGADWDHPVTTLPIMRWAINVAMLSTDRMIEQADAHIADNTREANMKRISGLIKAAAEDGITMGQIADRAKSIERHQREEIIHDLIIANRIEGRINKETGGRPSSRYFSIA